jgi:hypothetical protein
MIPLLPYWIAGQALLTCRCEGQNTCFADRLNREYFLFATRVGPLRGILALSKN